MPAVDLPRPAVNDFNLDIYGGISTTVPIGSNTNVTKEMDFRNATLAASSRGSRSPRAQSGAPRARHMKFHRPSAAFFSGHPARRVVVRPRRTRSPGPIVSLKHLQ